LPTSAGEPTADLSEAAATTVSDASGAFTFLGVPAGQYLLFVMKMPGPSTPGLSFWAQRTLAVGEANIANLPVVMQRGLRIAGSVTYDGAGQAKPAGRLTPFVESIAQWARSLSPEVMVAPDGRFSFPGFIAGRYLLTLPLPSGWYVKSAISAGRDVADLPFELTEDMTDVVVTVSDRGARVSGNVRDRTSKPDADARVITFPVDPRYWVDFSAYARRIREVVTDRDGAFVLSDLPPGDYFVVAASQAAIDWSVPRLLERLSAVATRVTLAEGERKSVDLQRAQVK
jgi:hypothetical protein